MKYIKTYENILKSVRDEELDGISPSAPYMEENKTDNNYYKIKEKANNWYYKIKYYYRKPGYKTYCFLNNEGEGWQMSKFWIEEDKLMIPSNEEIELYLIKKNALKYNL